MVVLIIGTLFALAGPLLMGNSDGLAGYMGMFMLIVGLFLINKGREKITVTNDKD